jgi:prophage antirepressor-like protein
MSTPTSSPSAVVQFQFQQHQVRALTVDGEPWFVAKDVCKALGLVWNSETRRVIPKRWRRRTEDHRRIISESAVYKLAFRADKPEADAFIKWMEAEVLPAIHNQGDAVSVPAVCETSQQYQEKCAEAMRQMVVFRADVDRIAFELNLVFADPFWGAQVDRIPENKKPFANAMNYAIQSFVMSLNKDIEAMTLLFTAYVEGEKLMHP